MKYNKKGQTEGIITFVVLVLLLLFLAPILFKVTLTPIDKFTSSIGLVDSTNKSVEASTFIRGKFTGMMDWVIFAVFIFSVLMLLITSFLIDIHPAFFIVYFFAAFCIIAFAPSFSSALGVFYDTHSPTAFGATDGGGNFITDYLPMTNFVYNNFGKIIAGIMILSGVIMYGKYKLSGGGQQGGVSY